MPTPPSLATTTPELVANLDAGARELYARRLERKLVLTKGQARALRDLVAASLAPEEFVAGRRRTRIHSLYFDTPDFALYQQSLQAGSASGLKLRVRAYSDADTGLADAGRFLEAKLAVTTDGAREKNKARMALPDSALEGLMAGAAVAAPRARKRFWKPLLAFMAASQARPQLTVSYVREAFVDATGELRVTFDEHYEATAIGARGASPCSKPATLDDTVILEIKYVGAVPAWLESALAVLGLPVEGMSFSKYKTAVGLLFPAERARQAC